MPNVSVNVNDRDELKKLAAEQYLKFFKRQSLTPSDITTRALTRCKTNTLHISLHKTGNLNEFCWQLTLYDHKGANVLASGNITRISDATTKLNIGTLSESVLNCSISANGRLIINKLNTSLNVLLESDVKISIFDFRSSGAVFICAPKTIINLHGPLVASQEFVIESDITAETNASIFSGGNLSIITSKLCDLEKASNITALAILKIYAPHKIMYDLTKLVGKVVDISLNVVDDMQLINNYGSNLTYEVLSDHAASKQITENLNFTHKLHIISPQVSYEIGSHAVATKIFSNNNFALEAKSLKLNHGALFANVLGLKIPEIELGHIHTTIIDSNGLYKVNEVYLGCNRNLIICANNNLQNFSGEIDANGEMYLDVNNLTTIGGRLIAARDVYFAGSHIELTIKKQETGEDQSTLTDLHVGFMRNGYEADKATARWVLRTCKILTTEPVVKIAGELYTAPDIKIINHCGHVTTKTSNLHNVTLKSETSFIEYKVRVTETYRYSKKVRFLGVQVDAQLHTAYAVSDHPIEQHGLVVHMATAEIYGSGVLSLHSPAIDGMLNAPYRDITLNGSSQIGQLTVRYNEMLANVRHTAEVDYRPGLLFGIASPGSGSIYQALAPICMPPLRSFKILVLDGNFFHAIDNPTLPFEYSPVQQAYQLHRMFEAKYNYAHFPGQEMGKDALRSWLHTNALLFNHESKKVNNLTPLSELSNLIRPMIYFRKTNILLPDNTMREGLRLEPVLPAFMLKQENSLTGLNILIKDDCHVTSSLVANKQIVTDMGNGNFTVEKLLQNSERTVQTLTVSNKVTNNSVRVISEPKIASRGRIEAEGINGTVKKLQTMGAEFNLGSRGINMQANQGTVFESVKETSYEASVSSGYDGRNVAQTFEHLATHKIYKTIINSTGPVKIESLLGDILDKGSVFNCPETAELQAHRGQVIQFLAECLKNDTPVEYAQECAKGWLEKTFTSENFFTALTAAFVIASQAFDSAAPATAGISLIGSLICAGLACVCDEKAKDIKIKEINQAEQVELALLVDKKNAAQSIITANCSKLINANSFEHTRSRNRVKFIVTKDASSIEELDSLKLVVDQETAKVDQHFHNLQLEIIQQASNYQEELDKKYLLQVKNINDHYNQARKKCKLAPGPSIGVGLSVDFGSTGSQVNATTYFTYNSHTSHAQVTLADFSTVATTDSWSNRRSYNDHAEDRPFREDVRRSDSLDDSVDAEEHNVNEEDSAYLHYEDIFRKRTREFEYGTFKTNNFAPTTNSVSSLNYGIKYNIPKLSNAYCFLNSTSLYHADTEVLALYNDYPQKSVFLTNNDVNQPSFWQMFNDPLFEQQTDYWDKANTAEYDGYFFSGAKQGLTELAQGGIQLGLQLGEKIGLASREDILNYTSTIATQKKLYELTPAAQSFTGKLGKVTAEAVVFSVPLGSGLKGYKLWAANAAFCGGAATLQPIYAYEDVSWNHRGREALVGATIGAVAAPVLTFAGTKVAPLIFTTTKKLINLPLSSYQVAFDLSRESCKPLWKKFSRQASHIYHDIDSDLRSLKIFKSRRQTGSSNGDLSIRDLDKLEYLEIKHYELIRQSTNDVELIANNVRWTKARIQRIKEHLFYNEHILDAGIKRFDPDHMVISAWDRLTNGIKTADDLAFLRHELFEAKFERIYNTNYITAHNSANYVGYKSVFEDISQEQLWNIAREFLHRFNLSNRI